MDEFYTQPDVALHCWRNLVSVLTDLGLANTAFFIEPSAGDGVFYNLLPINKRIGLDIAPRHNDVIKCNFLSGYKIHSNSTTNVVVGNPPFGKRGRLALSFFLKSTLLADTIAFILPVIFQKYFIHKQIPIDFKLIHSETLPRDSFRTPQGKLYSVNTVFQVWTRKYNDYLNYRLYSPPPIKHNDFTIWQYNNTKNTLNVFANPFDFAIPCQGWQDYSRRETVADNCEKHKQWMLIKANNNIVFNRLHNKIDYQELSLQNTTSVPGFRKGDLIEEYIRLYGMSPSKQLQLPTC